MNSLRLIAGFAASIALLEGSALIAQTASPAQSPARGTGSVVGFVSNSATKIMLEGAIVEVPQLRISAETDNSGRFVLTGLPAGTHEVQVSYIGLDTTRIEVAV